LNSIYEGITICYPQVTSATPADNLGSLEIVGTGSGGKAAIMAKNLD